MKYEERYKADGTFDLNGMVTNDNLHIFGEILLYVLYIIYFGYGVYNIYYLAQYLQGIFASVPTASLDVVFQAIKSYSWEAILAMVVIYAITLNVSYFVVKLFGRFAGIILYGTTFLQIALFAWLFFYIDTWGYRWIFLVPVALQVIVLVFWRKKLNLAIQYVKLGSEIVWEKRKLILPQFGQTFMVIVLTICHFITTIAVFFDITNVSGTVTLAGKTVEVSQGWIYAGYTGLFTFLMYMAFFVTLGLKIDMIHSYVRSKGKEMSIDHAWSIVRRRWWGLMGYAFSSTIIHLIQFFYKMAKKQVKPQSILDAAKLTAEATPTAPMSVDQKGTKSKKPPLRDRIWMGLNFFTLPALVLEDRLFFSACIRSLDLIGHNIPDLYIKHANVDKLFQMMRVSAFIVNGLIGAVFGYLFGWAFGFDTTVTYIAMGIGIGLFLWLGGVTSVLVLNDLNLAYITLMFMHTIDDLNGKKDFIDFQLKPQEEIEAKFAKKEQTKKEP